MSTVILPKISTSPAPGTRSGSALLPSIRSGVEKYRAQLRTMQEAGVLGANKRLIMPLSGLDFIPGYYVGQMRTYDLRLPADRAAKGFEKMHRAVAGHYQGENVFPAWSDFNCEVSHWQMNVLHDAFFEQTKEFARPGDVFLSKFMLDFLCVRESPGAAFQFMCRLIDVLPTRMFFVDYEKAHTIQTRTFPSADLGLAEYLVGTGKFRDITGSVFTGPDASQLDGRVIDQALDGKSIAVRIGVEGNRRTFQLPLGGQANILEKTS